MFCNPLRGIINILCLFCMYSSYRSKLALKSRKAFQSMEALEVDFFNPADDILDPFSGLHAKEAALVARDPTKVSRAALWLNIRQVFSLPRRMGSTDQVLNELVTILGSSFQVGTFLYRKLGRLGLGLHLQTFKYTSRSLTQVPNPQGRILNRMLS